MVDRIWLQDFGVSDTFIDVREQLDELKRIEHQGKEDQVAQDGQFDDTNRGVLFKNDKGGVEKRPDYRGEINVNGEDFELAAWIRKSQKGVVFMSLSVQPKQAQQGGGNTQTAQAADDDDIPF